MSKLSKYIIGAAVAAIVIFLIWYFSDIVLYIILSAVLAIIGKPLVGTLTRIRIGRRHIPRWLAALLALVTMWVVAVLFLWFFLPLVFSKLNELTGMDTSVLTEIFDKPLQSLQDFILQFFSIKNDSFSLAGELSNYISSLFNFDMINDALRSTVSMIAGTVVALFSITFITFFFLKQDNLFQNMLVALFPTKYESKIIHALNSVTKLLIRYFTGILAESAIIMLLLSVIFMLWGFSPDTAIFMGFVMGLLNVIPYIGPLIGTVLCVIVGVISPLEGMELGHTAMVIVGSILCVKGLDDFLIQPVLYSNRVNAHPLEIFIVILIAGSVAGVLGMLLAIPSYTVLRVFAKEFFNQFPLVQKLTENIDIEEQK